MKVSARQQSATAQALREAIEFEDPTGVRWWVSELPCRNVPGAKGPACLLFESHTAFRRVWRYPSDWRTLSAEELVGLSWSR